MIKAILDLALCGFIVACAVCAILKIRDQQTEIEQLRERLSEAQAETRLVTGWLYNKR